MEREVFISKKRNRKISINDHYRRILEKPNLSDHEIKVMREHLGLLAQTICEHVWGKEFY